VLAIAKETIKDLEMADILQSKDSWNLIIILPIPGSNIDLHMYVRKMTQMIVMKLMITISKIHCKR